MCLRLASGVFVGRPGLSVTCGSLRVRVRLQLCADRKGRVLRNSNLTLNIVSVREFDQSCFTESPQSRGFFQGRMALVPRNPKLSPPSKWWGCINVTKCSPMRAGYAACRPCQFIIQMLRGKTPINTSSVSGKPCAYIAHDKNGDW